MKKLLFYLLILIIPAVLFLNPQIRDYLAYKLSYSLCDSPISYKIDTVDPKFNLLRDDFTSDVDQAAKIWEVPTGKDLFVYDSKGELSINLIFDERQSLTNQINQLESQVKTNKQSLTPQINEYKALQASFENKLQSFKKEVSGWNSKGGAPAEIYDQLIKQQKDLQAEAQKLNGMAKDLNLSTQNYNSQVNELNETIKDFNADLTQRPEEGIFKGPENKIEVYFNISQPELIHTLSHELGHALGLGHVQNPKAMMYFRTNQSANLSLDDKEALDELCKRHSILEILQNYITHLQLKQVVEN